ncbi:hypothetical protein H4Q26_012960 [Puccinia striiformis f. sp. tritici PST-130]|nr:hypothetical protein H4Q26_012960 [Puccinia striiformis f. sp. tritici PST-130]
MAPSFTRALVRAAQCFQVVQDKTALLFNVSTPQILAHSVSRSTHLLTRLNAAQHKLVLRASRDGLLDRRLYGIGKTIISTALSRASNRLGEQTSYLKPIGTGSDSDDKHVSKYTDAEVSTKCLYTFSDPVSPHLAAERTRKQAAATGSISGALRIDRIGSLYVETAGVLKEEYTRIIGILNAGQGERSSVRAIDSPPELIANNSDKEFEQMNMFYDRITNPESSSSSILKHSLVNPSQVTVIDSAYKDCLMTTKLNLKIHPHPSRQMKIRNVLKIWILSFIKILTVQLLGGLSHSVTPIQDSSQTVGAGWANRAFFSDNGSTGVEVALKMGLTSYRRRHNLPPGVRFDLGVIGLKGSYHGDTIGAMDASEKSVYNSRVDWYKGRASGSHLRFFTSISIRIYDYPASLIIEPVVMEPGGMIFVDPLFQNVLISVVRNNPQLFGYYKGVMPWERNPDPPVDVKKDDWTGLPVIFDEVFSGLYRLGKPSAAGFLGQDIHPDIAVYSKILSAGTVPLSVTLAREEIFDAFRGDGPGSWDSAKRSWMAEIDPPSKADIWSFWGQSFVQQLTEFPEVEAPMTLGTVLAIYLKDRANSPGYTSCAAKEFLSRLQSSQLNGDEEIPMGLHARPLGNVAYLISSLNTPSETLEVIQSAILKSVQLKANQS